MGTESTDAPVLEACDLQKTYGRRRVVDGVNLRVERAEIVGLLGPNGAGKSTSFRMICGMVQPDRGRVYLEGRDVTDWPMFRRARDGHMGYLPQEPSVFKKLTVEQNISALLELLGMDRKARKVRTQELLEEFNITHIRKSKAAGLSGGERRRLEIARCLVSNPRIVMLDEPFAGIDPVTVQSIQGVIKQLRDSGISVLITDHAAREILGTVDRCYVIYQGQVLIDGTPDQVKRHPKVREEYLGDLDGAAGSGKPSVDAAWSEEEVAVPPAARGTAVPRPHFQGRIKRPRQISDL
ncbi:LPS export ABC transporter ATP-binding protein [Roseiconus nitratireducens]|uniref:LPS export ABC transporter ATP-binding protein n=1 Tax=Roseiconus nitratireducens TaxID=2605748 RepID=A0A5M6DES1_9BACT|nr:LPS export ABC transporter ATP-binding protein [Roseiconus nitratireducens]KAA5546044.1 LPS export ABC transporter ATP-binding protein [Roseiconus nitratireducens]